jgi:hypothetical protein
MLHIRGIFTRAIDMIRSGVKVKARRQIVAGGTLMNMEDWNPSMGPFFTPFTLSVLSEFTVWDFTILDPGPALPPHPSIQQTA